MPDVDVTVAVPVKDRREQMLRCVDALLAQDHPAFEILVLDNESSDGTPDAVRERARDASVPVRVEVVPGTVGKVRNSAGPMARGRYLAFTDSDCLPDPGWLSAATAVLDANPRLGVVQGRTLPEEPITDGWPATIHVESFSGRYESCNLVFRTDAFVASAGFDEEVGHFWEDVPAGLAIRRDGWDAEYVPDALVFHDVTYPGFWWHVKRQQKHRNLAPVLAKYPEIRRELLLWGVFVTARDARFTALLLALAAAGHPRTRPAAALLALPYVHQILFEKGLKPYGSFDPKSYAQSLLFDGSRFIGALRGGLRNGRIAL